jgi:hypothetical protein
MEPSDRKGKGARRPSRRKKPKQENLRFEPPGKQTGDTLHVIVNRGPSGEPIVDTLLTNQGVRRELLDRAKVTRFRSMREMRRKAFQERCLAAALLARRKVMAATTIAEIGDVDDMRRAISLLAVTLEGLVDVVVRVCADVRPR